MKTISDVLSSDDIIQKEGLFILKAGVGTGKTYFATRKLTSKGKVLYLCALRSIIDEINTSYSHSNLTAMTFAAFSKRFTFSSIINNIEKKTLDFDSIDSYDFIIIDEAHDLVTFEPFMKSIHDIKELLAQSDKKNILLMTATPEIIYIAYGIKYDKTSEEISLLKSKATPNKVVLYNDREKLRQCATKVDSKHKGIYYVYKVSTALKLEKELKEQGIRAVAVVGQGTEAGAKAMADVERAECMETIKSSVFPDNIDLVISTTKLREGINIHDVNVKYIFTELLGIIDLVQISGRVRKGADVLYGYYKDDKMITFEQIWNFTENRKALQLKVKLINDFYQSIEREVDKRIYLEGLKAEANKDLDEQRYGHHNKYRDFIDFNNEEYAIELFKLISIHKIAKDVRDYINHFLNIPIENIKVIDEQLLITTVERMIVKHRGFNIIYGIDNHNRLLKLFDVKTPSRIVNGLTKLGFNVEHNPQCTVYGVKEKQRYHFM